MARTRAPDHDSQREQILELAAAKFAQTSYPSTSMADLAAASGTSKARLYHYYESKEAILFDLLDRYTKRLMLIIAEVEGSSQRRGLSEREAFAELVRAFLTEYEAVVRRHAPEYDQVVGSRAEEASMRAFLGGHMELTTFANEQVFDQEGLAGRLMSSSYAPEPGDPEHAPMLAELRQIFDRHACEGKVVFPYVTLVYYGRLKPAR